MVFCGAKKENMLEVNVIIKLLLANESKTAYCFNYSLGGITIMQLFFEG